MIIWINGPFGVGKSTLAKDLMAVMSNVMLFDPEHVGKMLWQQVPRALHEDEFESEPVWRSTTLHLLRHCYERYSMNIVVPMTLATDVGFDEIVGCLLADGIQVHHYTLMASLECIDARLTKRGERRGGWESQQIKRCLDSLERPKFATHINTDWQLEREVTKRVYGLLQTRVSDRRISP